MIVLDACTDKSEEIVNSFTAYTHHKKLFTDFHSAGGARNAGLDAAEGDWILFMDDDDWFLPGAFRKIAEGTMKHTELDVLCFGFEWKGRGVTLQSMERRYPAVWNKAWRKDFIGDKRFPVWCHTEDVEFNRLVLPGAWFAYIPEPLYYYNFMRKGSISDRIRCGEYDNGQLPENVRGIAEGYEKWLKSQEF